MTRCLWIGNLICLMQVMIIQYVNVNVNKLHWWSYRYLYTDKTTWYDGWRKIVLLVRCEIQIVINLKIHASGSGNFHLFILTSSNNDLRDICSISKIKILNQALFSKLYFIRQLLFSCWYFLPSCWNKDRLIVVWIVPVLWISDLVWRNLPWQMVNNRFP